MSEFEQYREQVGLNSSNAQFFDDFDNSSFPSPIRVRSAGAGGTNFSSSDSKNLLNKNLERNSSFSKSETDSKKTAARRVLSFEDSDDKKWRDFSAGFEEDEVFNGSFGGASGKKGKFAEEIPREMPFFGSRSRKSLYSVIFNRRKASILKDGGTSMGIGEASLYHALAVIFLEFFAWGLLTVPIINVLAETFPTNKFLMNGLVLGVKGLLSFLSAPLIGALSDIWGRKFFLILTVFCTCLPIPWLRISPWWYFALFSVSGVFSVTFSVVLAYVADITEKEDRASAYGLVSATFGASFVTSPALGAWLSEAWSDEAVVALATGIAALDVFFILAAVPESLPQKLRHSWDRVSWEAADPFQSLKMVGEDYTVVVLCLVVFLSYLPEAGQFSCFFVYLWKVPESGSSPG